MQHANRITSVEATMGRFETWIDRVRNARRRRRTGDGGSVRRRPLRFEQYESRLALSAAVQTDLIAADSLQTSGQVLQTLWEATPGSAQWGDVTFTAPTAVGPAGNAAWFSLRSAQTVSHSFMAEHGGLIGLDSMPSSSGMVSQRATLAFNGGVSRGEFRLDDYILSADPLLDVDGTSGIAIDATQSSFDSSWSEGVKPPLDFGGDGLNSAGAGGNASGTDDANVTLIESPVLRITAPLPNANEEGGSIDVTAMVAPRALFASQHATALATSGVRTGTSALSKAETPSQRSRVGAADSDEMRARAVVYEVSLAREVSDESLDKTRAGRAPATPDTPSAPVDAPQAVSPAVTPVVIDANGEIAADDATPKAAERDAVKSYQTSILEQHRAEEQAALTAIAARDAALARLGDVSSELLAADLETASSRNQTLGMALAAVVGAGPLVRRIRRSKATRVAEQAAGLN
jgi:hypothetical protein